MIISLFFDSKQKNNLLGSMNNEELYVFFLKLYTFLDNDCSLINYWKFSVENFILLILNLFVF